MIDNNLNADYISVTRNKQYLIRNMVTWKPFHTPVVRWFLSWIPKKCPC